jgi:hypothetical protein
MRRNNKKKPFIYATNNQKTDRTICSKNQITKSEGIFNNLWIRLYHQY